MKYCMLTELDILTPSITEQINLILSAEYEHLQTVTSEYSENEPSELNHKYLLLPECQDTVDLYWQLKKKMVDHFAGQELFNFKIHQMHQALEEEIFNRLPAKIRNMPVPPYVRIQTMSDGDYMFPHQDTGNPNSRDTTFTLITSVGDNIETTWFWKVTEPHQIAAFTMPDIDKIERDVSCKLNEGETWLFDVHAIHSVERPPGYRSNRRTTINFRWTTTPASEIIAALS